MHRQRRDPGTRNALAFLSAATLLAGCATNLPPWNGAQSQQPVSASVPAGYYRVNPGDTLPRIAAAYGQRAQDIAQWNQIPMTAPLTVGQVLRVAPPSAFAPAPAYAPQPQAEAAPAPGAAPPALPPLSLEWPVRGPILQRFVPGRSSGILIGGAVGTPVRAAAAGRVVYAGTGIAAYGPLVIIKHNDSVVTAYGHNGRLLVKEDDVVTQGQQIAEMGGDANGVAAVQFEVRADGKPVDPLTLLPR